ncbi:hypothetical protein C942_00955 [Photobacterium marinum]|uniref:Uncharacterized protein n=1 Tax=Photobacterium marinum TaxID=1056511 RepID=L8JC82_9GAMM|nr:hypothetical protein [Photobacterium marinum]ELR65868.1 hypothetical protein C942_00955 [Photobacterium marinum]
MNKNKIESVLLILSFVLALTSFVYSTVDFIDKHRDNYELSIFSNKTIQSDNLPGEYKLSSDFVISNTGNRKLDIIDAWISIEIDNERISELLESKKWLDELSNYARDINYSNFSRLDSRWKLLHLSGGESEMINVTGIKSYNVGDYYHLLPSKTKSIDNQLDDILSVVENTNKARFSNDEYIELKMLRKRNSKYVSMILNLTVQLESNELKFVKVKYDNVVYYKKDLAGAPIHGFQLNSYFTRKNNLIKINIMKDGTDSLKHLII